jgi:ADP-ribose pyrophosphatase YjhB (NUDIX family)
MGRNRSKLKRDRLLPKVNKKGLTEEEFLKAYNPGDYERPSVSVDMLIFTVTEEEEKNYRKLPDKSLKLLMIKRADHPDIGKWALPGGFVEMKESLDEAARRELREETSLDNIYMEQLYTWGDVDRDPRTRVISVAYMTLLDSTSLEIKASDDAEDAKWFKVSCNLSEEKKIVTDSGYILEKIFNLKLTSDDEELNASVKVIKTVEGKISRIERTQLNSEGIAFDHAKMIEYAIERLRNKIEYTDIAFTLMPELFTLTELQQVYEVILGKELLKANFRRKVSGMVIETNEYKKEAGHRPSKLFKFNPEWSNEIE